MDAGADFDRCVFINCPFDAKYDPILQAVLFCVVYLGFTPRISRERTDAGENRLAKIVGLINASRYSIHDLSRSRASRKGEHARHNMPFELGIDYGCRQSTTDRRASKKFLVMAKKQYDYMKSLSDMAGCDIESHGGKFDNAVRKVRNWLVNDADAPRGTSAGRILGKYVDFQSWNYERQLAEDFSEEDIRQYPTKELFAAMMTWLAAGEPVAVVVSKSRA